MKNNLDAEILEYIQSNEYASIDGLAGKFYVSPSTVRRRLKALAERGLVLRTHGGAKVKDENLFTPSFTYRVHENSFQKKKIALRATELIKDGDLIFLDGTTSSFFIAQCLVKFKNIKVITNGIDTLALLAKNNIKAYSTGGFIQDANRSVLVGHYAEKMVEGFRADIAFFSARAVGEDGEIYDCFEEENVIRKAMISRAERKVFLCDGAKLENKASYRLCSLSNVDFVVSDAKIPSLEQTRTPTLIFCE